MHLKWMMKESKLLDKSLFEIKSFMPFSKTNEDALYINSLFSLKLYIFAKFALQTIFPPSRVEFKICKEMLSLVFSNISQKPEGPPLNFFILPW